MFSQTTTSSTTPDAELDESDLKDDSEDRPMLVTRLKSQAQRVATAAGGCCCSCSCCCCNSNDSGGTQPVRTA